MNRLTKKISKTIQDKYSLGSYLFYDFANADDTNKLLNKLGKLEDFMEMCGYDSVETMAGDIGYMKGYIESQTTEIIDLKNHTHDLNNTLLNLQLFLKDLRDSFHKEDETYEEIDNKLKELGEDR